MESLYSIHNPPWAEYPEDGFDLITTMDPEASRKRGGAPESMRRSHSARYSTTSQLMSAHRESASSRARTPPARTPPQSDSGSYASRSAHRAATPPPSTLGSQSASGGRGTQNRRPRERTPPPS